MPIKRLIYISIALFVLFFILGFPASAVWRHLAARSSGLELVGVSGTIWRGRADQVRWQLDPLGELYWQWQPAWPPYWTSQVQGPLLNAEANVHVGSGALQLSDIHARWPALLMRSPLPDTRLDGEFIAELDTFEWLEQQPQRISGTIQWHNARITAPVVVDLGQVQISITTAQSGIILLQVHSVGGGTLHVNGAGQVGNGRYQLNLHLRALDLNSNINQWLRLLGEPTSDGSVRIELSGPLHNATATG